jgi:hypothetical protein
MAAYLDTKLNKPALEAVACFDIQSFKPILNINLHNLHKTTSYISIWLKTDLLEK